LVVIQFCESLKVLLDLPSSPKWPGKPAKRPDHQYF
jgi:hypothetical protein